MSLSKSFPPPRNQSFTHYSKNYLPWLQIGTLGELSRKKTCSLLLSSGGWADGAAWWGSSTWPWAPRSCALQEPKYLGTERHQKGSSQNTGNMMFQRWVKGRHSTENTWKTDQQELRAHNLFPREIFLILPVIERPFGNNFYKLWFDRNFKWIYT